MMQSLHKTLFTAALAAAALFPLRAADGRIPISAVPFTISTPGVYYLTQNVSGAVITISASPVTLDLNGHTINSGGVSSNDQAQVTVRNGTINGSGVSLNVSAAVSRSSFRVEDLTLSGGTISITNGVANPMEIRVERNTITGSAGGITIIRANTGHVFGNQVNGCISGNYSIEVSTSANLNISRNIISCIAGIRLSSTFGSHVGYNVIGNSTGFSLALDPASSRNTLDHNTVTGTTGTGAAGNGMFINGQNNAITANHLAGNAQYGIYFFSGATGNIYTGNSLPGNTLGGVFGAAGNQSGGGNCNGTTCS